MPIWYLWQLFEKKYLLLIFIINQSCILFKNGGGLMYFKDFIKEFKEIYSTIEKGDYPYFLICGAGVSSPEIPLSNKIIDKCKKKLSERENYNVLLNESLEYKNEELYSYWLEKAFPSKELRRNFFEELINKAKISSSNLQIANILLSKKIFNIVVTTNFDDQIERALNYFGEFNYYVANNYLDNTCINLRKKDIQIVHVHGNYKTYSIKNLQHEISDVNEYSLSTRDLIKNILHSHSPIIVGYSGWENDIIMQEIKKRLEIDVPFNYYWICYSKEEIASKPKWLIDNPNVVFVIQDEINLDLLKIYKQAGIDIDISNNLSSDFFFQNIRSEFNIPIPSVLSNPLNICDNLINSISKNNVSYNLKGWIEEVNNLKEIVKSNGDKIKELYKFYENKNVNKVKQCISKILSKNSLINNLDFEKICKDILSNIISDKNISNKDREVFVKLALNIPEYRNLEGTRFCAACAFPYYMLMKEKPNKNIYLDKLENYFINNKYEQGYIALLKFKCILVPENREIVMKELLNIMSMHPVYSPLYLNLFPECILIISNICYKNNEYTDLEKLLKIIIDYRVKTKEIIGCSLKSIIFLAQNDKKEIARELFKPVIKSFNIDINSKEFIEEYVSKDI